MIELLTLFYANDDFGRSNVKVKYLGEAITIVAWELRRSDSAAFSPMSLRDSDGNVIMDGELLLLRARQYNEDNDLD